MKKGMNWRRVLALLLAALMVTSLAACSATQKPASEPQTTEAGSSAEKPTEETQEEVTLTWFVEGLSDEEIDAWRTSAIEPFEAQNPGIKIEMSANKDYETALKVQLASGTGADLVNLGGPSFIREYVSEDGTDDKILDLTAYIDQAGLENVVQTWALDTCKYNGKIYGIPNSYEGLGIYYNADMFNEYGYEIPRTFDELNAICADLKSRGIIPIAQGSSDQASVNEQILCEVLCAYAGRDTVKKALQGEIPWTDPVFNEAVTWLKEFWQNGYDNECKSHTITGNDALSLFYSQRAAMYITSTWIINNFSKECDFAYDMMYFPGKDESIAPSLMIGAGGVTAINAGTSHPDEAFKFLAFLFSDEQVAADLVTAGLQPLPRDIDRNRYGDLPQKSMDILDQLQDALANMETAGYCMWTFWPSECREFFIENCVAVWLDDMTVDDYLAGAQAAFERDMAAGGGVNIP